MSQKRKSPEREGEDYYSSDENDLCCKRCSCSSILEKLDMQQPEKKSKNEEQSGVPEQLASALSQIKVDQLMPWMKGCGLVSIPSTSSFYSALLTLLDNKILSAPIVENSKCLGFFDMLDAVSTVVEVMKKNGHLKKKPKEEDEYEFLEETLLMDSLKAKDLSDFSKRDELKSLEITDSALAAAKLLCLHHRIAVCDKGKVVGVVTQSGFMEYLSEEHGDILSKAKSRVGDLKLTAHVHTISTNVTAVEAFSLMRKVQVSALPIVNSHDDLVDIISSSDLTLWSEWVTEGNVLRFNNISALLYPVERFLEQSRAQRDVKLKSEQKGPISFNADSLLTDVIETILIYHVHRAFVVDKNSPKKIQSVVSFTDLIQHFIQSK